jgi:hypothetical protein
MARLLLLGPTAVRRERLVAELGVLVGLCADWRSIERGYDEG